MMASGARPGPAVRRRPPLSGGRGGIGVGVSISTLMMSLMWCCVSFYVGTMYAGKGVCPSKSSVSSHREHVESEAYQKHKETMNAALEDRDAKIKSLRDENEQLERKLQQAKQSAGNDGQDEDEQDNNNYNNGGGGIDDGGRYEEDTSKKNRDRMFPLSTRKFANAMGRVDKMEFFKNFDVGVSIDDPTAGDRDVLVIYNTPKSAPNGLAKHVTSSRPLIKFMTNASRAFENCDYVNVLLQTHDTRRPQCTAIVPQYEAFHLYRYARANMNYQTGLPKGKVDHDINQFQLVGRGYQGDSGRNEFVPPKKKDIQQNWDYLQNYLAVMNDILQELDPILDIIKYRIPNNHNPNRKGAIIVMVVNFGQSEVLLNFICNARAKGLEDGLKHIIVFATDVETKELMESFGMTTYYDERIFGNAPAGEARMYGDKNFVAMMMTKVIVVQLVNLLGYDLLFQDADIVWYKEPLDWFHHEYNQIHSETNTNPFQEFDVFFQDDGGHTVRYAPLSANSGFYYMKYNDKTQYLLSSLLLSGDQIIKFDSHQQALIVKLNEHSSLFGLRTKVLNRNMEEFPGGYHYHQKTGKYLRAYFRGEIHPVIFHMSWTKNKDYKIAFFQQMGEWYLHDQCTHVPLHDIMENYPDYDKSNLYTNCCTADKQPLFTCHYRDKPSIHPCPDSPPLDAGKPSWWDYKEKK